MTQPPPFSSFPDLTGMKEGIQMGHDTTGNTGITPLPSFTSFPSFPDLNADNSATSSRKRQRKDSDEHDRDGKTSSHRRHERRESQRDGSSTHSLHNRIDKPKRDDKHRNDDQSRRSGRYPDSKSRDLDPSKERPRDRDRYQDQARERDRDRDRERDRGRERRHHGDKRDRSRSAEGKRKERRRYDDYDDEKRIRQREKEKQRARDREAAMVIAGGSKHRQQRNEEDTSSAWYETSRRDTSIPERPSSDNAYFVDAIGDRDVTRYGATSSFQPPRYHRDFGGRVIGMRGDQRIVYSRDRSQKGIELVTVGGPSSTPRYLSHSIQSSQSPRILLRPAETSFEMMDDFTPFEIISRSPEEDDAPAYRSISKVDDVRDDEDAALEAALGSLRTLEDDRKMCRVEHERYLASHPEDIERWIRYSTLHLQHSEGRPSKPSELVDPAKHPTTRANAEVTLSMLSRALEAHPSNFESPDLHLAYLRAAEAFWPPGKVTERWKNVLRELRARNVPEQQMMNLYLGYIEWREGQGFGAADGREAVGGVDEVIEVYSDVLDRLRSARDFADQDALEENMIYVFLRACLFMKQTGYTERAIATFQALIEITFFRPNHLRPPQPPFDRHEWLTGVMVEFEDFWDSEVPRIGEPGARGWKDTHSSLEHVNVPSSREMEEPSSESSDPYARFFDAERRADKAFALPGRVTDIDLLNDDPFQFVIFSDVSPFLFVVQTPSARLQLIYAFLNFLGLPFNPPGASTASPVSSDPHLRWVMAQNEVLRSAMWPPRPTTKRILWQTVGGEPMEPEQPRILRSPFTCPVKGWVSERSTLFAHSEWVRDVDAADIAHVDIEVARNALALLRPLVLDPAFDLAIFAFEAAISPKAAVKYAKSILSTDRNNLALWDGYARLERQKGNTTVARKVYITAIQAALERMATAQEQTLEDLELDLQDLWASWAEMEWEEGMEVRCLEVLVMAAGHKRDLMSRCSTPENTSSFPVEPVILIKAKHHYQKHRSDSPSYLFLASLFANVMEGVEMARDGLLDVVATLPAGSAEAEECYQLAIKLIYIHTSRHTSPASLTRDLLERAITDFPDNTLFLSLYMWGESGGRIYGRVHRLVSRLTNDDPEVHNGIVSQLWSIWAEAMSAGRTFWDAGGHGAERVRGALDRSINSKIGKRSTVLWMLYIEFEVHMGNLSGAKALCYRAMAAVGAKDLYLLPFSPRLRPAFEPRELRALDELMAERGIRVRVASENYWESGDYDDYELDERDEDEEEGGDYEYGMLRDREELKPY